MADWDKQVRITDGGFSGFQKMKVHRLQASGYQEKQPLFIAAPEGLQRIAAAFHRCNSPRRYFRTSCARGSSST
jgi:hypothetical protein